MNPGDHIADLHPPGGETQRLARYAESVLASAFREAGWAVSRPKSAGTDLLCSKDQLSYAIEIKALAGRSRRVLLRALLADAILQASARAAGIGATPLAVLAASSMSPAVSAELADYAREFGRGVAWGTLDQRGRFELHGPGLESVVPPRQPSALPGDVAREPASKRATGDPFTDLGQWLLKVLVAPNIPVRWLAAQRKPVRTITDLASAADVSLASVSRSMSAFESAGYVVKLDGALRPARIESLFEDWRRVASLRPLAERHARFLLPTSAPARRLREVLAARQAVRRAEPGPEKGRKAGGVAGARGQRACLALFAACDELDVGHVRGAPLHLYSDDLSQQFLESLELHPVEHREQADVTVRRPRFPESVFRACVLVRGVPVADIIQCWLDISFHPSRGSEQAAEILQRLRIAEWDQ